MYHVIAELSASSSIATAARKSTRSDVEDTPGRKPQAPSSAKK
jgi:hypothetical protein